MKIERIQALIIHPRVDKLLNVTQINYVSIWILA